MARKIAFVFIFISISFLLGNIAIAQSVTEEGEEAPADAAAQANNPLANMKAFNLQNYYIPELSGIDGNGNMGEAWESVWVQTWPAAVEDTLGFGEYIITDTGGTLALSTDILTATRPDAFTVIVPFAAFTGGHVADEDIAGRSDRFQVNVLFLGGDRTGRDRPLGQRQDHQSQGQAPPL